MASEDEISGFIRSTFRSVWSLELLLFLMEHRTRSWSSAELVGALRASELIVAQGLDALLAAGLVAIDETDCARFSPATRDLEQRAEEVRERYARSPDAVRRAIIAAASGSLSAFANAFRLRKD